MFDKLFGREKKPLQQPAIPFGRYSDNNKTIEKVACWTEAENLYKEKKYTESIRAFFSYLGDEVTGNVNFSVNGADFSFEIYQGSKIVRGRGDQAHLQAEVSLAKMPQPSVPVMRRLLEQNFSLYYSRYSLDGERLCMRFDSDIETANPNKLYYALKELATRADKQDDLLVQDFSALESLDTGHIIEIPDQEKETRYAFMQKWIGDTLQYLQALDAEKLGGGISYMLLALAFRIDYLIGPEGSFQAELEKIPILYFSKDEKPVSEKNNDMIEGFIKLKSKPKEELFRSLFRNKSCFAIVAPQTQNIIAEAISNAINNIGWYRDNNYLPVAQQICEYGISYCQYSYSLPRPLSALFQVFMQVNYSDYFGALGFLDTYYDGIKNKFDKEGIISAVSAIETNWRGKYPKLRFKAEGLKFDNLFNFNQGYLNELKGLNFDSK